MRNDEIDRLIQDVCQLAGEDPETAVQRALEERRSRLYCKQATLDGGASLRRLWAEERKVTRAHRVN